MGALKPRTTSRVGQLVNSQIAGVALALLMVQHSAARRQRSYAD